MLLQIVEMLRKACIEKYDKNKHQRITNTFLCYKESKISTHEIYEI